MQNVSWVSLWLPFSMQSFQPYYDAWSEAQEASRPRLLTTVQMIRAQRQSVKSSGFERIGTLQRALEALDKQVFADFY